MKQHNSLIKFTNFWDCDSTERIALSLSIKENSFFSFLQVNGFYRNEEADILREANQPFNNRFRTEGGIIKKSCSSVVSQYIGKSN